MKKRVLVDKGKIQNQSEGKILEGACSSYNILQPKDEFVATPPLAPNSKTLSLKEDVDNIKM